MRAANHFGEPGQVDYHDHRLVVDRRRRPGAARPISTTAWVTGVRSLDADDLRRPCGPSEGPFAEYPMAALVLHISREVIHHGSELCLMRDLYRTMGAGS